MVVEFKLPDLGEGITEGEIRKWLVKEGDEVKKDQSLAELETDKAVVEMPSPAAGKVIKIYHTAGSLVKVGETLVTIGAEGEAAPTLEARKPSVSVVGELPEAPEARPPQAPPHQAPVSQISEIQALPAVRQLAAQLGVDITKVKGTGPDDRVTEEDVQKAKEAPRERPRLVPKFDVYGYIERRPVKGVRRSVAKKMIESQTRAAHVTAMEEADVTELVALREREKKTLMDTRKIHLTYMPFIIKSIVEALKENPILNSSYNDETDEIIIKKYYNIGFAVATEDGLIVPVVKGADQKNIVELAEEVERLAEQTNSRKVDLGDLKGGTFTITNYGVFGGTYGTPIINYPEGAILGTGKIVDAPRVVEGEIKIRKILYLSLSFDHRIMDGADAAKFMNSLRKYLEDPELLLITMKEAD